ncbi:hypothetical protein IRJ41_002661, partial [Triplophysa rosa]
MVCLYQNLYDNASDSGSCHSSDSNSSDRTAKHICKYYVNDSCRYGAGCRLNHNPKSHASRGPNEHRERKSYDSDEDDGRPYRWQLDLGDGWEDIANDHILEAQYSRPNTKGIRIYNTRAGIETEWLWYYRGDHGWYQYGEK